MSNLAYGCKAGVARTRKRLVEAHASQTCLCGKLSDVPCPSNVTESGEKESRIIFIGAGGEVGGNVLFRLEVVGSVVASEGLFSLGHDQVSQQAAISVASRMSLI